MLDSLRSLFDRITEKLRELPRSWKRVLMIGLPLAVAVPLALILFISALRPSDASAAVDEAALRSLEAASRVMAAPQATIAPTPTPTPTPTPEPTPTLVPDLAVQLKAYSTELDMRVTVVDEQGEPVKGVAFPLVFVYPDGETHDEVTDLEGQLYRSELAEGDYRVSLAPVEGYLPAEELSFHVVGKRAYQPIADVREQAEVKAVAELPVAEVKQAQASAPTAVVESIDTDTLAAQAAAPPAPQPDTPGSGEIVIIGSEPEPATEPEPAPEPEPTVTYVQPDPYYEYSFETGPNGFLLLSDGSESDVLPVSDGRTLSGLRRVVTIMRCDADGITEVDAIPDEAEEGVEYIEEESSEPVSLLNEDGSPVPGYQITATLVVPDPVPVEVPASPPPAPQEPAPVTDTPAVTVVDTPFGWRSEADGTCFYDIFGNRVTGLKEIDGKLYYFDDYGVKASTLGIDVSYFNGPIDWNQVKAHGIDFAIIRLAGRTWGSGVLFEDGNSYKMMENGGRYLQEARAAGLKIGAYVWSSAVNTNEAVEEASLALQILGGMPLDLPLYIDMEYSGNYPYGRADRLSAQQRTEIVQAFCTTAMNGGYRPGVYAGQNYWKEAISYNACAGAGYSIWMASYTNGQRLPTAFPWIYSVWQCTSSARIRGIGGDCDLDVIF